MGSSMPCSIKHTQLTITDTQEIQIKYFLKQIKVNNIVKYSEKLPFEDNVSERKDDLKREVLKVKSI